MTKERKPTGREINTIYILFGIVLILFGMWLLYLGVKTQEGIEPQTVPCYDESGNTINELTCTETTNEQVTLFLLLGMIVMIGGAIMTLIGILK